MKKKLFIIGVSIISLLFSCKKDSSSGLSSSSPDIIVGAYLGTIDGSTNYTKIKVNVQKISGNNYQVVIDTTLPSLPNFNMTFLQSTVGENDYSIPQQTVNSVQIVGGGLLGATDCSYSSTINTIQFKINNNTTGDIFLYTGTKQ